MLRNSLYPAILISALALSACGGDSSSSDESNNTLTGQFIDAPVSGLAYSASPSGLTGTTDALGSFNYKVGDTVSFAIPGGSGPSVTLGSAKGAIKIFVLDLANGLVVSQVLHMLNVSTNPNVMAVGGLTLPPFVATSLNDFITSGGQLSGTTAAALATAVQTANTGVTFANPTASAASTINSLVDQLSSSGQITCASSACTTLINQATNLVTSLGGSPTDVSSITLPILTYTHALAYDAANNIAVAADRLSYLPSTAPGTVTRGLGTSDPSPYTDTVYSVSNNVISTLYDGQSPTCTPTTPGCSSDVVSYYSDPSGIYVATDNNTDYTGTAAGAHNIAIGTVTPLLTSLTLTSLDGRTLTFPSSPSGICSGSGSVVLKIVSNTFLSGCNGLNGASGTVQDGAGLNPAMPGVVLLTTTTDGKKRALALVDGSVNASQSGHMAIVTLDTRGNVNDFNGIYAFTVQ